MSFIIILLDHVGLCVLTSEQYSESMVVFCTCGDYYSERVPAKRMFKESCLTLAPGEDYLIESLEQWTLYTFKAVLL